MISVVSQSARRTASELLSLSLLLLLLLLLLSSI
jgi:hypothetical protein